MNSLDIAAFDVLFREACMKCFGHPLTEPLTETESKVLYNQVFDQTGLTVGWKSCKNYSSFILSHGPGKKENPSVATLDTLARYVLGAPYTTEVERKKGEGHYPWWYRYREQVARSGKKGVEPVGGRGEMEGSGTGAVMLGVTVERMGRGKFVRAGVVFVGLAAVIVGLTLFFRGRGFTQFTDHFLSVQEDSLRGRGWIIASEDSAWWKRRGEIPGCLTLFTLKGDNWPDSSHAPLISNLLLRRIPCDCWTLEVHLHHFIPRENWQQAGILLLEDTGYAGKSVRISIAYNDYMGEGPKFRTILVQAITYLGNGFGKPEEIAHIPLFNVDSLDANPVLARNLDHAALRIQRLGQKFRILYASGIAENTSFKEIAVHEFAMEPRYAGLFALRGFVDGQREMPASFNLFKLNCEACGGR